MPCREHWALRNHALELTSLRPAADGPPLASTEIGVVVLDECQPGTRLFDKDDISAVLNGVELCQLLKKNSPRRLPVLLATAHAMSGDRERYLEASGADGYLEKPVYDSAMLVARVRELMG